MNGAAPPRVVVCRPSHGPPFREHVKCVERLARALPDWIHMTMAGPCVDICRAVLAEDALKEEPDALLWLDADMTFSAQTCQDIIQSALDLGAIVGCAYVSKKTGSEIQASFRDNPKTIGCYKSGALYAANAIGFGVVAMPASILERIAAFHSLPHQSVGPKTLRPWFCNDPRWEKMHSDDYAFCRRAREAGIGIYCDTRHRVGHIGEYTYMLEDCRRRELIEDLTFSEHAADESKAAE